MRLTLNGKLREVTPVATVGELLEQLGVHRMVVVERNGAILPRERLAMEPVQEDDRLEIVHMVGGGQE